MIEILRNNLGYKLLSLALAFLLWIYVQNAENPLMSKTFPLTPRVMNVPGHLRQPTNLPKINVTVRDRKDVVSRIRDEEIIAFVSLRGATEGEHRFPVQKRFSDRLAMTDTPHVDKIEPKEILVNLETIEATTKNVLLHAEPPLGSRWLDTVIDPDKVMLTGPRSLLKGIRVLARIDKKNATLPSGEEYRESVRVVLEDAQGQPVESSEIRVEPTKVAFHGRLEVQFKQFPVHVTYMGAPATSYRVHGPMEAVPNTVMLAGSDEALRQVNEVLTEPVDVTGANKPIERVVRLRVPPGLKLRGTTRIKVMIPIEQDGAGGNLPSPAPLRGD